eukprot:249888_1
MSSKVPHLRGNFSLPLDASSTTSSLSSSSLLSISSQTNTCISDTTTHYTHDPYQYCRKCLVPFLSRKNLYSHIRDFHWTQFKCTTCHTQFSSITSLNKHMANVHSNAVVSSKIKCKFCCQSFAKKRYLTKHIQNNHTHKATDGKKQCNICCKWYADNTRLKIHQRIHFGVKPYECSVCHKTFSDKSGYNRHIAKHKKKKKKKKKQRIECEICGKVFRYPCDLKVHKRSHTKEILFTCDVCDKGFSYAGNYNRHRKTCNESGRCYLCDRIFQSDQDLEKHIVGYHNGVIIHI